MHANKAQFATEKQSSSRSLPGVSGDGNDHSMQIPRKRELARK